MSKPFAPWETATNVQQARQSGLLGAGAANPLSLLAAIVFSALLWPVYGGVSVAIGLVFGRLLALDLTTYTLPNIYTVPLLAVGLASAWGHGRFGQALLVMLCLYLFAEVLQRGMGRKGKKAGLGGGDLKLLAALFAFLPAGSALFAVALGCVFWLPVAMLKPKAMVPFGVPIVLGWALLLRWPQLAEDLPNWLFSAIS